MNHVSAGHPAANGKSLKCELKRQRVWEGEILEEHEVLRRYDIEYTELKQGQKWSIDAIVRLRIDRMLGLWNFCSIF